MIKTLPIAISAGLASALLLSIVGTVASAMAPLAFLCFLAPLPLFVSGLGWGYKTTALASLIGIVILAIIAGPHIAITYFILVGFPASLLTYFALMSRESDDQTNNIEWYPLGRLVVIGALCSSALSLLMLIYAGGDLETLNKTIKQIISSMVSQQSRFSDLESASPEAALIVKNFLVAFAPAASAAFWFVATLANMYIAQKILKTTGKAIRTDVNLSTMTYPQTYLISFAGSLVLTFIGGIPAFVAGIYAAVGIMAFAILGFITIHKITEGHTFRPLILGAVYSAVIFFHWLALIIIMAVGLFDTFFNLRAKNKNNET